MPTRTILSFSRSNAVAKPVFLPDAAANVLTCCLRATRTRVGHHDYTRAQTDDKYTHEGAPYPGITIPLPGCYGNQPTGRPASLLVFKQELLSKTLKSIYIEYGESLPLCSHHVVSFTTNDFVRSTRWASNAMEEGAPSW